MKTKPSVFFYSKALAVKVMGLSLMTAAFLFSCDKSNDDLMTSPDQASRNEEVRKGQLNGQSITYIKKDGLNFFQGDIVLSDKQLEEGATANKGGASFSRWPEGKIYYTVAGNMGSINANKITSAVNEYNSKTNTQWIPVPHRAIM